MSVIVRCGAADIERDAGRVLWFEYAFRALCGVINAESHGKSGSNGEIELKLPFWRGEMP